MIQLTTFQEMTTLEYDEIVLKKALIEINEVIKENAYEFRIALEISSDSIESRLYKNAITHFYIKNGFKIVNYPTMIYIDWSHPNINVSTEPSDIQTLNDLPLYFRSSDLYSILTGGQDLRKLSHRTLEHYIRQEVKKLISIDGSSSIISVGIACNMTGDQLNKLFAPELLKLNKQYTETLLTFVTGGLFKITINDFPEIYTELPYEILFGTHIY